MTTWCLRPTVDTPPISSQEGRDLSAHAAAVRGCTASAQLRVRQAAARALLSLLGRGSCVPELLSLVHSLPALPPIIGNNQVSYDLAAGCPDHWACSVTRQV